MNVLYNEIDSYAAQWLRNLGSAGHISPGRVEERSIKLLKSTDFTGVQRAHFFAGIGVWEYALRLAGFPDAVEAWTGSCPCQPFSVAGRGDGIDDERHLWPAWFDLIDLWRPAVVLGEQVASPGGLAWLDAVSADLEGAGYTFGAADLPAAGVGAPHKRSRLYFCAYSDEFARGQGREVFGRRDSRGNAQPWPGSWSGGSGARADADAEGAGRGAGRAGEARDGGDAARVESDRLREALDSSDSRRAGSGRDPRAGSGRDPRAVSLSKAESEGQRGVPWNFTDLAGAASSTVNGHEPERERERLEGLAGYVNGGRGPGWLDALAVGSAAEAGATRGFWGGCDWYGCRDGKFRPIGPGLFPLAHGAPSRVGRLRAYGNAIVGPLAATFVRATLDAFADTLGGS